MGKNKDHELTGSECDHSKLRKLDKLIVKARHQSKPVTLQKHPSTVQKISELEKRAAEEILKDVARGVRRYEMVGAQGWLKPACLTTDKKFLERVLRSTQPKSRSRDQ
ncbi:unnamed protein product [Thelazia callipaeda]|uniref:UPF0488 protein CG14286 n=1 Tax=Thelazia callipaeda TaxID=103827 RepID=A0A0N5D9C1_THECL|nr:unnamed protein product [Thelazia callipaeda]